jgi:hypothetical protein
MTEARLRDLGGSRHSLHEAIGRLDEAAPASAVRAGSKPDGGPASAWFGGPWRIVIALGAVAVVALTWLMAT